jgi:hypothetical protein
LIESGQDSYSSSHMLHIFLSILWAFHKTPYEVQQIKKINVDTLV